MKEIKVAIFGTTGYSANYYRALKTPLRENVRLVGAVDPFAGAFDECPLYKTPEALFDAQTPDVTVVATPIHFHREHALSAFAHGSNVLTEKPIAADVNSAREMLAARDRAGRLLGVGFQMCADPAIRALKKDADAGLFGAPVALKAIVLGPRGRAYYERGSRWAGKKYDREGRPVFDSVVNNATAHYLMNMLFITGRPIAEMTCQTYRANPIETYDTAIVNAKDGAGTRVFLAVSHAAGPEWEQSPMFEYVYEKATIRMGERGARGGARLTAAFQNGAIKDYGIEGGVYMAGFWNMIDAVRGEDTIACDGECALMHAQAVEKMRTLQPDSAPFPERLVETAGDYRVVKGLGEAMWRCYEHMEPLPAAFEG